MNQNNIKPQELRVNCLVMYQWFEKSSIDGKQKTTIHRETIKILGIDSANNRVLTKTNQTRKNHTWISIDKIRPIPLSEEVLLRCGFEKSSDGEHFFIGHYGFCLVFDGQDYCMKPVINDVKVIAYCRNLHQLQNLYYSLTQTELEVIL